MPIKYDQTLYSRLNAETQTEVDRVNAEANRLMPSDVWEGAIGDCKLRCARRWISWSAGRKKTCPLEVRKAINPGEGYDVVATSKSDLLPDAISNPDISALRTEVEKTLDAALALRDQDNWTDGLAIAVTVTDDGGYAGGPDYGRDKGGVELSIRRAAIRVQARTLRSNSGEISVLSRGRTEPLKERPGDPVVPLVDGEKLPIRLDADVARTVLDDTEENHAKLDCVSELVARFSKQLQARFNPDEMHAHGIPDVEDVLEIMDRAAAELKDTSSFGMT
ncbi:hypothetical protein [Salipiger mucosus]|uniref:hypothetical protein n=1 Tax=Salipiger mucosus TaxID=263378 RepID=UPI0003728B9C|nr:hypothetical protein [Salipiger mucosus]